MGGYASEKNISKKLLRQIKREIFTPTLRGLRNIGSPFSGILYANIMLTPDGPQVLEFNCRTGDPETQIQLPLIKNDLYKNFLVSATGNGVLEPLKFRPGYTAGVVLAAEGYPDAEKTVKGDIVHGLDTVFNFEYYMFHATTRMREDEQIVTGGGRILEVVTYHPRDKHVAFNQAYSMIGEDAIHFIGMQYRRNLN